MARHADPKVKSESRKVKSKVKSRRFLSGAIFGLENMRDHAWWIGLEIGASGDSALDFGEKSVENRGGIFGG